MNGRSFLSGEQLYRRVNSIECWGAQPLDTTVCEIAILFIFCIIVRILNLQCGLVSHSLMIYRNLLLLLTKCMQPTPAQSCAIFIM